MGDNRVAGPKPTNFTSVAAALLAVAVAGPAAAQGQATLDGLYQAAKAANQTKVAIFGPPSPDLRNKLRKAFAERFPDIELDYSGMSGSDIGNKIKAEQKANLNTVDIIITGASTATLILKPIKAIRPLDSMIVVPEARDGKNWLGGKLAWVDDDHTMLAMLAAITPACAVNSTLVKPGELTSDADLLNPKWKGKIIANDPLRPGSANVAFRRFYDLHGAEFLRKLIKDQEVVFNANIRQPLDWTAKGQYAIVIGASPAVITDYLEKGVTTISADHNIDWKDTMSNSAGFGGLSMPVTVPHEAAAKLFVNWLLTREGQATLADGINSPSRRLDVDVAAVPRFLKPRADREYMDVFLESHTLHPNVNQMRDTIRALRGL